MFNNRIQLKRRHIFYNNICVNTAVVFNGLAVFVYKSTTELIILRIGPQATLNLASTVLKFLMHHTEQGINEGDFYTFEGLFQLEQEGSRRCNTMNVLTLYLYKCLSNGRPLSSEDGR